MYVDYSLVPADAVCSWNSVNSWDVSWSSLYINDIQHLSSENINYSKWNLGIILEIQILN